MNGRKRVLVVDDEEKIVRLMTRFLEAHGYDVHAELCGQAGVDAAVAEKPDLMILDVRLPDIDGFEVSTRIRQVYDQVSLPILMVTAMDRREDQERGIASGANAYMAKPFGFGELDLAIEQLIH